MKVLMFIREVASRRIFQQQHFGILNDWLYTRKSFMIKNIVVKHNEIIGPINNHLTEGIDMYIGKFQTVLK